MVKASLDGLHEKYISILCAILKDVIWRLQIVLTDLSRFDIQSWFLSLASVSRFCLFFIFFSDTFKFSCDNPSAEQLLTVILLDAKEV